TTKATAGALEKLAQSKVPKKKRTVKPGVRIIRRKDAPWTLAIDGSSSFIADLHAAVENQNKKPLDVVEDTFFGDDSAQRSTVVTNV
ncbi:hypothetical protein NL329_30240, partial [Klebsiella pneumoniae]|nr:hypothetical protein [Klebsiella pneumoniae]